MNVSIVISNYNYGRYVGAAIDSALAQTWPNLRVIVVDDGSTDDSWDEIRRFGCRIDALRIDNSGQGGAMNAGLALTRDEFVLLLDADDMLDRTCVTVCLHLCTEGVAKVQFPLRRIDGEGRILGGTVPYLMHEGDVRPIIRAFGHYGGPPASGNFFRRSAITRYFPLRPEHWRRAADTVPFLLAPFHGRVVNVPFPLGAYRLHRPSSAPGVLGNVGRTLAEQLLSEEMRRARALELLARHDGIVLDGPFLPLPWSLRLRALSWRLQPADHPYPLDNACTLLRLQAESMRAWPGYRRAERWAALLWLAAAAWLPLPLVSGLARTNTAAAPRALLRRLVGRAA
jgi:hypothetical protein